MKSWQIHYSEQSSVIQLKCGKNIKVSCLTTEIILTFMLFKLHVVLTSIKICIIILNLFEMAVQFLSRIEEPFLKVTGKDS